MRCIARCPGSQNSYRSRCATNQWASKDKAFHGLSYAYLMEELKRIDPAAATGRVILAHLGNGASLAAVKDRESIDTSMGFTPASALVMSTNEELMIAPSVDRVLGLK